jgi:hypothetical protein
MIAVLAEIGIREQNLIGGVVAANVLLAGRAWRSSKRRSEKWGVGALAVIGSVHREQRRQT